MIRSMARHDSPASPAVDARPAAPARSAVFLDFDGTVAHHGVIPRAHVETIRAARANGHALVLATGRPVCLIPPQVSELFDAHVLAAGTHVSVDGEVLSDLVFDAELAARTLDVLDEAEASTILEAADAIYCTAEAAEEFARALGPEAQAATTTPVAGPGAIGVGNEQVLAAFHVRESLRGVAFAKVLVRRAELPLEEVAERIGPLVRALPSSIQGDRSASGELQLAAADKVDGMRLVAERLGIPMERTVAVGDGANDVLMLEAAGVAVGIDGSRPEVLAAADITAAPPVDGGLVEAFERLGLI